MHTECWRSDKQDLGSQSMLSRAIESLVEETQARQARVEALMQEMTMEASQAKASTSGILAKV